jgi:transposase
VLNTGASFDVVDGARSRHRNAIGWFAGDESHEGEPRGAVHMQITTIGLDIAKNAFQVHGIDAAEKVVVRKQLRRSQLLAFFKALPPCLVGMEACAAHYWARELTKVGHQVRLMPAKDVKAYVKRNKNDAADAEAICEAVRRPTMRFVLIKSPEQQGRLMQHRARDLLIRQRTQVINGLRAHLAELGITAAQGNAGLKELLAIIASDEDARLPADAHAVLIVLPAELQAMQTLITSIEKRIMAQHRASKESQRVETIPGIGVVGATAITATVTDPNIFRSGRDFAAWIGLVPRQDSTGGSGRSRNKAIAICDAFWWLERMRSCGARASSRRSFPGSHNSSPANRSGSWRWHSPTRWRASPGRCWPRAAPIGRLRLRQRRKRTGDGKMR